MEDELGHSLAGHEAKATVWENVHLTVGSQGIFNLMSHGRIVVLDAGKRSSRRAAEDVVKEIFQRD